MSLRDQMDLIIDYYRSVKPNLELNGELIDIYEGNLYFYVDELLKRQLSPQSYEAAKQRITPINLFKKIIDKLSTIYSPPPTRRIVNGTPQDEQLFAWYQENSNVNAAMMNASQLYNMCKSTLIQPLAHDQKLFIRVNNNNQFFVISEDTINPLEPTIAVLVCGTPDKQEFIAWNDTEVLKFNIDKDVDTTYMNELGNPDGVNEYGELPFLYVNQSQRKLTPPADLDMRMMVCLAPLILTDLAYAVMYQCFSIIYGINVDDSGLKMAPNAFWNFQSDPANPVKPEIGSIKPQVDIDQVLGLVQSLIALFLNTRGIRPGAIGKLDKDTFATGISKMVDEMDTVELRRNQVEVFTKAEKEMWDFILHTAHPYWVKAGEVPSMPEFSAECSVETNFTEQVPMQDRGQLVDALNKEVLAGFTTVMNAIKILNPDMTDEQVQELMGEINVSKMATSGGQSPQGPDVVGSNGSGRSLYGGGQTAQ